MNSASACGGGGEAAHHLDAGARAGVEVDVLGAGADPADRAQHRRVVRAPARRA